MDTGWRDVATTFCKLRLNEAVLWEQEAKMVRQMPDKAELVSEKSALLCKGTKVEFVIIAMIQFVNWDYWGGQLEGFTYQAGRYGTCTM